ncbi:hypothetical protein [Sciscionella marina]|uniref:hypothetical protein n=1 Tax=Sciscionella marina TaxID=508770 RepID=UPI00036F38FB|nr:hypothetical protein [Sciscionella marina]
MIASVHIADVGFPAALADLRTPRVAGLRYGVMLIAAPLSGSLIPRPQPGRIGLIAFWQDDDALDSFLKRHRTAARLAGGLRVRLAPVRASGEWPGFNHDSVSGRAEAGAVTVTLGSLRTRQTGRFLRASAQAGASALAAPGFIWGTALARPPIVATCSLWQDSAAIAAYAYRPGAHASVIAADNQKPFHRRSTFLRFRPYETTGQLGGTNPLPAGRFPAG